MVEPQELSKEDLRVAINGYVIGEVNKYVEQTAKNKKKAEELIEKLKNGELQMKVSFEEKEKFRKKGKITTKDKEVKKGKKKSEDN